MTVITFSHLGKSELNKLNNSFSQPESKKKSKFYLMINGPERGNKINPVVY